MNYAYEIKNQTNMQQDPNGGKPMDQGPSTIICMEEATFHDIPWLLTVPDSGSKPLRASVTSPEVTGKTQANRSLACVHKEIRRV